MLMRCIRAEVHKLRGTLGAMPVAALELLLAMCGHKLPRV